MKIKKKFNCFLVVLFAVSLANNKVEQKSIKNHQFQNLNSIKENKSVFKKNYDNKEPKIIYENLINFSLIHDFTARQIAFNNALTKNLIYTLAFSNFQNFRQNKINNWISEINFINLKNTLKGNFSIKKSFIASFIFIEFEKLTIKEHFFNLNFLNNFSKLNTIYISNKISKSKNATKQTIFDELKNDVTQQTFFNANKYYKQNRNYFLNQYRNIVDNNRIGVAVIEAGDRNNPNPLASLVDKNNFYYYNTSNNNIHKIYNRYDYWI